MIEQPKTRRNSQGKRKERVAFCALCAFSAVSPRFLLFYAAIKSGYFNLADLTRNNIITRLNISNIPTIWCN